MSPAVVPVELRHIESFNECVGEVARERRFLAIVEPFPIDQTAMWVSLARERANPFFIALDAERVVGWCEIRRDTLPGRGHGGMLGIGVRAAWRGRGLGTRLLEVSLAAARACGIERVELWVRSPNARAIALYRRFGFGDEGRRVDAIRLDQGSEDELLMALRLPRPA